MLAKPDRIRLRPMLDATHEALGYARGRSRRELDQNSMLARAIVKCPEIVGEAASRVTPETRSLASAIPWAQISGMRNRLIHAYFDINLDEVWATVLNDLPLLARMPETLLADSEKE